MFGMKESSISCVQQWYNKWKGGLKGENLGREDENIWECRGKELGLFLGKDWRVQKSGKVEGSCRE